MCKQATILAIDDDFDNLVLLQYILDSSTCKVISENDSEQGWLKALQLQPDLILLDVIIPGTNGIDLCRRLKADAKTRKIPVIAVTALARDEDRQLIADAGFDGYISKPFLIEELSELIERFLLCVC